MLRHLSINNIALIENVEIEFGNGLNIMTGETGAGKSIIIDSIMAILGNRTRKDIIRTDEDTALVEVLFEINNEELLLSREIKNNNKSICRINGKVVTATMLREFGERLIDIHGQHDSQSLLNIDNHIQLLDSFGGNEIKELKNIFSNKLKMQNEYKYNLKNLSGNESERRRKMDFLQFQINEIDQENLSEEKEEKLIQEKKLLLNSEKIINSLSNSYDIISNNSLDGETIIDRLNSCITEINNIAHIDEKFSTILKGLESAMYDLTDIADTTRDYRDKIEFNTERLEFVLESLDKISRLKKKYGNSVSEIIDYMNNNKKELEEFKDSEEKAKEFEIKIYKIEEELKDLSENIHTMRIKAAGILKSQISNELCDLSMRNTIFEVMIDYLYDKNKSLQNYLVDGLNKVEFLISTNPGEPLKPLAKIASGGEMSRIMLAIKSILAKVDKIHTLIFDEIDIGISGSTADKVGEKLSNLSKNHQVICVTHLAQIASKADINYLIEKNIENNVSKTKVKKLDENETINEIARILAGSDITDLSKEHAREMLGYIRR